MSQYEFNAWDCATLGRGFAALLQAGPLDRTHCDRLIGADLALPPETGIRICATLAAGSGEYAPMATPARLRDGLDLGGRPLAAGTEITPEIILTAQSNPTPTLGGEFVIGRIGQDGPRMLFAPVGSTSARELQVSRAGPCDHRPLGRNRFARGTLVDTPHGALPVEELDAGDEVLMRDGGVQLVSWVARRRHGALELLLDPALRPIRIMTGALTGGRPGQDLLVSQDHRLLVDDWRAPVLFGEDEILVPARALLNDRNVLVECPAAGVEYFSILTDGDTMICANGLWAETLLPEDGLNAGLADAARRTAAGRQAGMTAPAGRPVPALPFQTPACIAA